MYSVIPKATSGVGVKKRKIDIRWGKWKTKNKAVALSLTILLRMLIFKTKLNGTGHQTGWKGKTQIY